MAQSREDDLEVPQVRSTSARVDEDVVVEDVEEPADGLAEHHVAHSVHRVGRVAVALLHDVRHEGAARRHEAGEGDGLGLETHLLVRVLEVQLGADAVRGEAAPDSAHVGYRRGEGDRVLVPWLEVDDEPSLRAVVLGDGEH